MDFDGYMGQDVCHAQLLLVCVCIFALPDGLYVDSFPLVYAAHASDLGSYILSCALLKRTGRSRRDQHGSVNVPPTPAIISFHGNYGVSRIYFQTDMHQ